VEEQLRPNIGRRFDYGSSLQVKVRTLLRESSREDFPSPAMSMSLCYFTAETMPSDSEVVVLSWWGRTHIPDLGGWVNCSVAGWSNDSRDIREGIWSYDSTPIGRRSPQCIVNRIADNRIRSTCAVKTDSASTCSTSDKIILDVVAISAKNDAGFGGFTDSPDRPIIDTALRPTAAR